MKWKKKKKSLTISTSMTCTTAWMMCNKSVEDDWFPIFFYQKQNINIQLYQTDVCTHYKIDAHQSNGCNGRVFAQCNVQKKNEETIKQIMCHCFVICFSNCKVKQLQFWIVSKIIHLPSWQCTFFLHWKKKLHLMNKRTVWDNYANDFRMYWGKELKIVGSSLRCILFKDCQW